MPQTKLVCKQSSVIVNNVYLFITSLPVKLETSNKLLNYLMLLQHQMNSTSTSHNKQSREFFGQKTVIANAGDQLIIVHSLVQFISPLSVKLETSNKAQNRV